jgi:hypothetical protein
MASSPCATHTGGTPPCRILAHLMYTGTCYGICAGSMQVGHKETGAQRGNQRAKGASGEQLPMRARIGDTEVERREGLE